MPMRRSGQRPVRIGRTRLRTRQVSDPRPAGRSLPHPMGGRQGRPWSAHLQADSPPSVDERRPPQHSTTRTRTSARLVFCRHSTSSSVAVPASCGCKRIECFRGPHPAEKQSPTRLVCAPCATLENQGWQSPRKDAETLVGSVMVKVDTVGMRKNCSNAIARRWPAMTPQPYRTATLTPLRNRRSTFSIPKNCWVHFARRETELNHHSAIQIRFLDRTDSDRSAVRTVFLSIGSAASSSSGG